MEFLQKEEERLMACMEMHEDSARRLREDIDAIRKVRELLLDHPNGVCQPDGSCA